MSEGRKFQIDLTLKIVATLIAIFGVWKYFAEKDAAATAAAKARSIGFIERYASSDMRGAREALFSFWLAQESFVDHIRSNAITQREYGNFVRFSFPRYGDRKAMQSALFSLANLYDQVFHCRAAGICDSAILDEYFCPIAAQQQRIYGPFYEILRAGVASTDFGLSLQRYRDSCV